MGRRKRTTGNENLADLIEEDVNILIHLTNNIDTLFTADFQHRAERVLPRLLEYVSPISGFDHDLLSHYLFVIGKAITSNTSAVKFVMKYPDLLKNMINYLPYLTEKEKQTKISNSPEMICMALIFEILHLCVIGSRKNTAFWEELRSGNKNNLYDIGMAIPSYNKILCERHNEFVLSLGIVQECEVIFPHNVHTAIKVINNAKKYQTKPDPWSRLDAYIAKETSRLSMFLKFVVIFTILLVLMWWGGCAWSHIVIFAAIMYKFQPKYYSYTSYCSSPVCNKKDHVRSNHFRKCAKCQLTRYCSSSCQSDHWEKYGHKHICANLSATMRDNHWSDVHYLN